MISLKQIRLVNVPNPNNPTLKTNDYNLVATLDKRDKEVREVFNVVQELGASRLVPLSRTGVNKRGMASQHIWSLTGMYSVQLRLNYATISDAELIVLLYELLDTFNILIKRQVPPALIEFDTDRVFITPQGTVAFMLWGIQNKPQTRTLTDLLEDILNKARPSDSTDDMLIKALKEKLPKSKTELADFAKAVYATYIGVIDRAKGNENKEEEKVPSGFKVPSKSKPQTKSKGDSNTDSKPVLSADEPKEIHPKEVQSQRGTQASTPTSEPKARSLFNTNVAILADDLDKTTLLSDEADDKTEILASEEVPEEVTYLLTRASNQESFVLKEGDNVVGRGDKSDIKITLNKRISGRHCSITLTNGELTLEDLNSSNGTTYNDTRLEPNNKVNINVDDSLFIADEVFYISKEVQ